MDNDPTNVDEGGGKTPPSNINPSPPGSNYINLLKDSEAINPVNVEKGNKKIKSTVWNRLPPLSSAGLILGIIVLSIITIYIIFLIFYLRKDQSNEDLKAIFTQNIPSANPDSAFSHKLELIKVLQQRNKDYRDYSIQISQIVLLNLLLPILTGILGYIFGTREERKAEQPISNH